MDIAMRKLTDDERFMKAAIREARKAEKLEEVPIGCVIVYEGKIIARGYNRRNTDKNTLSHAELNAIKKASKKLGDWRLEGCTIYITLEPCQMCSGAIVQARITRAVIGSMNAKAGCAGSVLNILEMPQFNHQVEVIRGVLQEECSEMLSEFFRRLRTKKKEEKQKFDVDELVARAKALNDVIRCKQGEGDAKKTGDKDVNLGAQFGLNEAFHIGPAYFKDYNPADVDDTWKNRIEPILREYVRGRDAKKVEEFIKACEKAFTKADEVKAGQNNQNEQDKQTTPPPVEETPGTGTSVDQSGGTAAQESAHKGGDEA